MFYDFRAIATPTRALIIERVTWEKLFFLQLQDANSSKAPSVIRVCGGNSSMSTSSSIYSNTSCSSRHEPVRPRTPHISRGSLSAQFMQCHRFYWSHEKQPLIIIYLSIIGREENKLDKNCMRSDYCLIALSHLGGIQWCDQAKWS